LTRRTTLVLAAVVLALVAGPTMAETPQLDMAPMEAGVDQGPAQDGLVADQGPTTDQGPTVDQGPSTDGGIGTDASTTKKDDDGCSCTVSSQPGASGGLMLLLGLALAPLALRRRR